jgi:NTE family protein
MLLRIMLRRTHRGIGRPPYEQIALVLQGGGALGAYQGGVYQAMHEAEIEPTWVAGISIGSINAALIAGNAPEDRVAALRGFWDGITAPHGGLIGGAWDALDPPAHGTDMRRWVNGAHAAAALFQGAPGFFSPRLPPPFFQPPGSGEAVSYYDTAALRKTLLEYVDFDRINAGVIRPEHVMASGALPPGFPAVEIDGEQYWDGGIVSNTPLQWVVQDRPMRDTVAFQVDLWSAQGLLPRDLTEVAMRQKEIQFSSRTRQNTDQFMQLQRLRVALRKLLEKVPTDLLESEEGRLLHQAATDTVIKVVHLIYRSRQHESDSKDYEFSRRSMREHWEAGHLDAVRTLRDPEALKRPHPDICVGTYDLARSDAR